jgi:radical SAM protein with 4Fe4S-binding SPASM domain
MLLPQTFTLHLRLTRDCNAHCSYCSSAGVSEGRMSQEDFKKSINWISEVFFKRLRIGKNHHLTAEYLGGEVLVIPHNELSSNVEYARSVFNPMVKNYRDGAQSNLISSPRRVKELYDLFEGRIGTSWDTKTGQRHIRGKAELYTAILQTSLKTLKEERDSNPGRVIVIDEKTAPYMAQEVEDAINGKYSLVFRPVFQGGSPEISPASLDNLMENYIAAYNVWISKGMPERIEPFSTLMERRFVDLTGKIQGISTSLQYCPFQSNCAFKSLSLDPDGSLYICQEMADSNNYKLGNAISGTFNEEIWKRLSKRSSKLNKSCQTCTWRNSCAGGCMNEAIQHHGDPFAKTELCPLWMRIFTEIDKDLKKSSILKKINTLEFGNTQ